MLNMLFAAVNGQYCFPLLFLVNYYIGTIFQIVSYLLYLKDANAVVSQEPSAEIEPDMAVQVSSMIWTLFLFFSFLRV